MLQVEVSYGSYYAEGRESRPKPFIFWEASTPMRGVCRGSFPTTVQEDEPFNIWANGEVHHDVFEDESDNVEASSVPSWHTAVEMLAPCAGWLYGIVAIVTTFLVNWTGIDVAVCVGTAIYVLQSLQIPVRRVAVCVGAAVRVIQIRKLPVWRKNTAMKVLSFFAGRVYGILAIVTTFLVNWTGIDVTVCIGAVMRVVQSRKISVWRKELEGFLYAAVAVIPNWTRLCVIETRDTIVIRASIWRKALDRKRSQLHWAVRPCKLRTTPRFLLLVLLVAIVAFLTTYVTSLIPFSLSTSFDKAWIRAGIVAEASAAEVAMVPRQYCTAHFRNQNEEPRIIIDSTSTDYGITAGRDYKNGTSSVLVGTPGNSSCPDISLIGNTAIASAITPAMTLAVAIPLTATIERPKVKYKALHLLGLLLRKPPYPVLPIHATASCSDWIQNLSAERKSVVDTHRQRIRFQSISAVFMPPSHVNSSMCWNAHWLSRQCPPGMQAMLDEETRLTGAQDSTPLSLPASKVSLLNTLFPALFVHLHDLSATYLRRISCFIGRQNWEALQYAVTPSRSLDGNDGDEGLRHHEKTGPAAYAPEEAELLGWGHSHFRDKLCIIGLQLPPAMPPETETFPPPECTVALPPAKPPETTTISQLDWTLAITSVLDRLRYVPSTPPSGAQVLLPRVRGRTTLWPRSAGNTPLVDRLASLADPVDFSISLVGLLHRPWYKGLSESCCKFRRLDKCARQHQHRLDKKKAWSVERRRAAAAERSRQRTRFRAFILAPMTLSATAIASDDQGWAAHQHSFSNAVFQITKLLRFWLLDEEAGPIQCRHLYCQVMAQNVVVNLVWSNRFQHYILEKPPSRHHVTPFAVHYFLWVGQTAMLFRERQLCTDRKLVTFTARKRADKQRERTATEPSRGRTRFLIDKKIAQSVERKRADDMLVPSVERKRGAVTSLPWQQSRFQPVLLRWKTLVPLCSTKICFAMVDIPEDSIRRSHGSLLNAGQADQRYRYTMVADDEDKHTLQCWGYPGLKPCIRFVRLQAHLCEASEPQGLYKSSFLSNDVTLPTLNGRACLWYARCTGYRERQPIKGPTDINVTGNGIPAGSILISLPPSEQKVAMCTPKYAQHIHRANLLMLEQNREIDPVHHWPAYLESSGRALLCCLWMNEQRLILVNLGIEACLGTESKAFLVRHHVTLEQYYKYVPVDPPCIGICRAATAGFLAWLAKIRSLRPMGLGWGTIDLDPCHINFLDAGRSHGGKILPFQPCSRSAEFLGVSWAHCQPTCEITGIPSRQTPHGVHDLPFSMTHSSEKAPPAEWGNVVHWQSVLCDLEFGNDGSGNDEPYRLHYEWLNEDERRVRREEELRHYEQLMSVVVRGFPRDSSDPLTCYMFSSRSDTSRGSELQGAHVGGLTARTLPVYVPPAPNISNADGLSRRSQRECKTLNVVNSISYAYGPDSEQDELILDFYYAKLQVSLPQGISWCNAIYVSSTHFDNSEEGNNIDVCPIYLHTSEEGNIEDYLPSPVSTVLVNRSQDAPGTTCLAITIFNSENTPAASSLGANKDDAPVGEHELGCYYTTAFGQVLSPGTARYNIEEAVEQCAQYAHRSRHTRGLSIQLIRCHLCTIEEQGLGFKPDQGPVLYVNARLAALFEYEDLQDQSTAKSKTGHLSPVEIHRMWFRRSLKHSSAIQWESPCIRPTCSPYETVSRCGSRHRSSAKFVLRFNFGAYVTIKSTASEDNSGALLQWPQQSALPCMLKQILVAHQWFWSQTCEGTDTYRVRIKPEEQKANEAIKRSCSLSSHPKAGDGRVIFVRLLIPRLLHMHPRLRCSVKRKCNSCSVKRKCNCRGLCRQRSFGEFHVNRLEYPEVP